MAEKSAATRNTKLLVACPLTRFLWLGWTAILQPALFPRPSAIGFLRSGQRQQHSPNKNGRLSKAAPSASVGLRSTFPLSRHPPLRPGQKNGPVVFFRVRQRKGEMSENNRPGKPGFSKPHYQRKEETPCRRAYSAMTAPDRPANRR